MRSGGRTMGTHGATENRSLLHPHPLPRAPGLRRFAHRHLTAGPAGRHRRLVSAPPGAADQGAWLISEVSWLASTRSTCCPVEPCAATFCGGLFFVRECASVARNTSHPNARGVERSRPVRLNPEIVQKSTNKTVI